LRSDSVEELILARQGVGTLGEGVADLAETKHISVTRVDGEELSRLSAVVHTQGVVAIARMPVDPPSEAPLFPSPGPSVGLLLDGVTDPGNLGTLVRTADAAGCITLLRTPGSGDLYNPKVVRSAVGSLLALPPRSLEPAHIVAKARAEGVATVLLSAEGSEALSDFTAPERMLLIAGSEPRGAGALIRQAATHTLSIPLRRGAESLNVAIAAAVALFSLRDREPRGR
jgi:TrmH family RNA methyltransferase